MAKSFCTCCGDVLPVVIILCAGLDMLMSSTTSRNLFVVSGCDHKSIILVGSLHVGIESIGMSMIRASGPLPLSRIALNAAAILAHCSGESGAHVMVGCCRDSMAAFMMLGGLLSLVYSVRASCIVASVWCRLREMLDVSVFCFVGWEMLLSCVATSNG
jgi:hypothetical protein